MTAVVKSTVLTLAAQHISRHVWSQQSQRQDASGLSCDSLPCAPLMTLGHPGFCKRMLSNGDTLMLNMKVQQPNVWVKCFDRTSTQ